MMSKLDATSELFLSFIKILDSYGAQEWSLRMVTATVSLLLTTVPRVSLPCFVVPGILNITCFQTSSTS